MKTRSVVGKKMKVVLILMLSLLVNNILFVRVASAESMMLRLELNKPDEEKFEPQIYTVGAFSLTSGKVGHFDIVNFQSELEGEIWGLDFGLGYVLSGNSPMVVYLGFGFMTGYNKDQSEFIPGIYPEVGLLFTLKQGVAFTATAKRYYNVYEEETDAIMLGLALKY
jgi:hypothetical protein